MFSRIFLLSLLSFWLLTACNPEKLDHGKEIAAEAENHKVKRITKDMIAREAQRIGDSLVVTTFKAVRQPVADSCNMLQYDAVAELADLYQAQPAYVFTTDTQKHRALQQNRQTWQKGLKFNDPNLSEAMVYTVGDSLYYIRPISAQSAALLPCYKMGAADNTAQAGQWLIAFHKQGMIDAITRKVKKSRRGRR